MDSGERSLNEHLSCNERGRSKSIFLRHALLALALDKCCGSVWDWRLAIPIPMDYRLSTVRDFSRDWTLLSMGKGYGATRDQLT